MTLVRGIGRTMLSSYFVLSGIRAVRHPEEFVQDAAPLADRLVPTAKRFAPDPIGDFIPEDPTTLVRVNGALQLAGGLALATGKGRRFGAGLLALSLIPTTLARHPFWTRTDPAEKAEDRHQFIKNVSLLGGVIIASRDTEGKPGLTWRANETREAALKRTRGAKKAARKAVKQARGNDVATAAIGSGLALVGEVVEESRKAKKQAAKRAKAAAERAQKEAKHARKRAKKTGAKLQKSAGRAQQRALDAAEDATKTVRKAAGEARSHLGEHIELGVN
jgi:uncharacterized membrane protein YphA (DoxX/SURF4 family)